MAETGQEENRGDDLDAPVTSSLTSSPASAEGMATPDQPDRERASVTASVRASVAKEAEEAAKAKLPQQSVRSVLLSPPPTSDQKPAKKPPKRSRQKKDNRDRVLVDHAEPIKGSIYHRLLNEGPGGDDELCWADYLLNNKVGGNRSVTYSQGHVAKVLNTTQPTISKSLAAIRLDLAKIEANKRLQERMEQQKFPQFIYIYNMSDGELFEVVEYFVEWRARHFKAPAQGKKSNSDYVTPIHQQRWVFLILRAIRDGRNQGILSPPRHGKTELMIHLDTFLITRVNPNIRLVKICKSEGLAKKAVGAVLDHLSENRSLIEESLPEGGEFRPEHGSRRPWNNLEFTVATRAITGIKSPTMVAVGAGGTLLSRDGDVFTLDDIEDHHTTRTPESREETRAWHANDVMSRKEEHTAMIYIGSRQHPDDLPGHLLDNPEWEWVVERAHDESLCEVEDPDNPDNWDKHIDCMLWPEMRSYEWLMSVKNDPERGKYFAMIYQNEEQDSEIDVFTRELVDGCRDNTLVVGEYKKGQWIGEDDLLHQIRLIGGLDPSATGYQAAFLWGVDVSIDTMYAIDMVNKKGGGIARAREMVQDWYEQYKLQVWVIEENLYHGGIVQDELLRAYCNLHNIILIPHETGHNKWDENLGVSALAGKMRKGEIVIPWGDQQTINLFTQYRKQLINFSRDRIKKKRGRSSGVTDIVMASWFPYETIKRWREEWVQDQIEQQIQDDMYQFAHMDEIYSSMFQSVFANTFR